MQRNPLNQGALSYYHDHVDEIRRDIEEDKAYAKKMQAKTPSLVQQKLSKLHGKKD